MIQRKELSLLPRMASARARSGIPGGVDVRRILASVVNGQVSVIMEIKEVARHTSENDPREGAFLQHF